MSESESDDTSVTVTLSEVEAKVLEWAVQAYRETGEQDPAINELATQLRGLAVGFSTRRTTDRGKSRE